MGLQSLKASEPYQINVEEAIDAPKETAQKLVEETLCMDFRDWLVRSANLAFGNSFEPGSLRCHNSQYDVENYLRLLFYLAKEHCWETIIHTETELPHPEQIQSDVTFSLDYHKFVEDLKQKKLNPLLLFKIFPKIVSAHYDRDISVMRPMLMESKLELEILKYRDISDQFANLQPNKDHGALRSYDGGLLLYQHIALDGFKEFSLIMNKLINYCQGSQTQQICKPPEKSILPIPWLKKQVIDPKRFLSCKDIDPSMLVSTGGALEHLELFATTYLHLGYMPFYALTAIDNLSTMSSVINLLDHLETQYRCSEFHLSDEKVGTTENKVPHCCIGIDKSELKLIDQAMKNQDLTHLVSIMLELQQLGENLVLPSPYKKPRILVLSNTRLIDAYRKQESFTSQAHANVLRQSLPKIHEFPISTVNLLRYATVQNETASSRKADAKRPTGFDQADFYLNFLAERVTENSNPVQELKPWMSPHDPDLLRSYIQENVARKISYANSELARTKLSFSEENGSKIYIKQSSAMYELKLFLDNQMYKRSSSRKTPWLQGRYILASTINPVWNFYKPSGLLDKLWYLMILLGTLAYAGVTFYNTYSLNKKQKMNNDEYSKFKPLESPTLILFFLSGCFIIYMLIWKT